jgi:hypothetical protein
MVRLAAAVRVEIDRIGAVVGEAEQALADYPAAEPPRRELRGIGDIVHDAYTGIERIAEKIAGELGGGVPAGPAWHRQLLEDMTLDLPGLRPPVLAPARAQALDELLRFRHLFRNRYGFELEWRRLRPLLERLPAVWRDTRADLERFLGFLDAAGRG